MKTYLTITILLLTGFYLQAQTRLHDQLSVVLTNPNRPAQLEIDLVYGSIHIVGYGGQTVLIDAVSPLAPTNPKEEPIQTALKRIRKANPMGLSAEQENNIIKLRTNSNQFPVNLTVKVPRHMALKLRTYDKGDIQVENVEGNLEVDNTNGAIRLLNVGGSVVANTYKGLLRASLQPTHFTKPMAFSTMGGKIELSYPASLKANLKVKSEQGEVFSDYTLAPSGTQTNRSVDPARTQSTLDEWLYGQLNGGGPQILISNYLGDIYLKQVK